MKKDDKYYDLKSLLEEKVKEFIEICEELDRSWEDELNDVLSDGQRGANIKDIRQLI